MRVLPDLACCPFLRKKSGLGLQPILLPFFFKSQEAPLPAPSIWTKSESSTNMTTADLNFPGCRPLVPPSPQTHSPVRVKEDKKRELSSGLASASMTSPSPGKTWLFLLLSYFERSLERAFLAAGKACACEINRAAATAGLCYFLLCSFCIFHSGHLFSLSVREINESFLSKLFKSRLCCLQHFFRPLLILGSRVSHYSLCSPLSASGPLPSTCSCSSIRGYKELMAVAHTS